MEQFMIPCDFGGRRSPFPIYIGECDPGFHPLEQQAAWLLRERGGVIPIEVMNSFARLQEIAIENDVSFEELCVYAMNEAMAEPEADDTDDPVRAMEDGSTGEPASAGPGDDALTTETEPFVDFDPALAHDDPSDALATVQSVPRPLSSTSLPPPPPPVPPGPGYPTWSDQWSGWLWLNEAERSWYHFRDGTWVRL